MKDEIKLSNVRHSLTHILASAMLEMFPKAQLGVGPVIETGFYYDFLLPRTLTPEDLSKLEKRMRALIKEKLGFERQEMETGEAKKFFSERKQPFKVELIEDIEKHGTTKASEIFGESNAPQPPLKLRGGDSPKANGGVMVSLYQTGKFIDLCRGGHVDNTGQIDPQSFKLDKVAGAYWRGNEKNPMLTRIYGLSFATPQELVAHVQMLEEAKKRDHRKIGKELDLFVFSELVGSGLPLFTPKGTILREELNNYSQALRLKAGFERVWIPHITKSELYKISGHWAKFGDELFLVKSQETSDELVLKPMNCPHHQQIYASRPRSYRDLPIKYLETTTIYRDEKAGELLGLSRVRSVTQDDSHTFCRPDQIEEVYHTLIQIVQEFYGVIGMPLKARLSFRDPKQPEKYLGEPELWDRAQSILLKIAKENKLDYFEAPGEAAFYGPKIDFMAVDAIGREWQVATPQLDFVQPARFGIIYTDSDGAEKTPVMIHFALLGSIERFLSVYIEHTAGVFPVWLSPVQIYIASVGEAHGVAVRKLGDILCKEGMRVEIDDGSDTVGYKIRKAEKQKIPYMLVIGDKEKSLRKVTVRVRGQKEQREMAVSAFVKQVKKEIEKKS